MDSSAQQKRPHETDDDSEDSEVEEMECSSLELKRVNPSLQEWQIKNILAATIGNFRASFHRKRGCITRFAQCARETLV